jgi:PIN domain nuclease of toxin-antitoxin system
LGGFTPNSVLDTCCIIWAISAPDSLSPNATALLQAEDSEIFVSPISAAEIACAYNRGRITLSAHWKRWFRHYCVEVNGWQVANISLEVIEEAYSLPEHFHADPADRILAATSRLLKCVLLTADHKILGYPHVHALW